MKDNDQLILVDCGYPGFLPLIEAQMKRIGFTIGDLTKIIITHHDHDHLGSLKAILEANPLIEVICSEEQIDYVTGKKKSLRIIQAEERQAVLPEDQKADGIAFQNLLKSVQYVDKATSVKPGDILPWCGGIEIIDTKGHMPGHISLYLKEFKTLITGDALVVVKNTLTLAYPSSNFNMKDTIESVRRIQRYDIDTLFCYHGGVYEKDIKGTLEKIVNKKWD